MGITIRLDANADATKKMLGDVKTSIKEVKEDARATGKALSEALGGPEVVSAAKHLDAVAVAADHAAKSTAGLDSEQRRNTSTMQAADNVMDGRHNRFTNEVRLLEQIHGPLLRYESDLATLDRLMERGTITATQYANQVEKLNVQLEKTHPTKGWDSTAGTQFGPTLDPAKAGMGGGGPDAGGGLGSAAATLGIAVGVGAAIAGVKELAFAIIDSNERWIEMTNSVRKFTDANHDVGDVIHRVHEISSEIQAPMTDTIALYDRVHNATASLYLSTGTVVDVTKTLGLVAKENNVPLEAVEGTLKRLAFAADTGKISTRELRAMFSTMPEMSRVLADAFHVTQDEFDKLATSGKISARDIYLAIAAYYPQAAEKIKDFTEGAGTEFRKLIDDQGKLTFSDQTAKTEYEKWIDVQKRARDAQEQQNLTVKLGEDALARFTRGLELTKHAADMMFTDAMTQRVKAYTQAIDDAHNKANNFGAQASVLTAAAALGGVPGGLAIEAQRDATKATEEAQFAGESYGKTMQQLVDRSDDLHNKIADLRAGMASGKLTTDQYNLAAKELAQTLKATGEAALSALQKMENKLLKPFADYREELLAIDALQQKMPEHADLWAEELEKIHAKNPGMLLLEATIKRHVAAFDAATKAAREYNVAYGNRDGRVDDRVGFLMPHPDGTDDPLVHKAGGERMKADEIRESQAAEAAMAATEASIAKKEEEAQNRRNAAMQQFQDVAQPYRDEVVKLTAAQDELGLSDLELALDLAKVRDKYNDMKTPMEVYAKAEIDAKAKLDAHIYSLDAFNNKMRENREAAGIGTLADGAHDAFQSIKKDASDAALGMNLVTTGFSDLNAGVMDLLNSKGSLSDWFSSTISGFAALIEKALAAKLILAAIGGGGGGYTGPDNSAAIIPSLSGLWGFAGGGGGVVTGSGGTDSQVVAFRATPGERFSVETPEQQGRSAGSRGGGGGGVSIKNIITPDRRALVDFLRSDEGRREIANVVRQAGRQR